jgi:ribosomal protein S5
MNVVRATMKALQAIHSPQPIAATRGKKIKEILA